jgi:Flp pilus assembly protein TadG
MQLASIARARRGAVSVLFATMIIPIVGLVGLAIDYGIWNESFSSLSLAASAAALNAAKTAASAAANNDTNYISEGQTAGSQWFLAELGQGSYAADSGTSPPTVSVTRQAAMITANVSYTSTVSSVFGRIYRKALYPITVNATATMSAGSYLEVVLMLDNSSSMGLGATVADMNTLMKRSPCDQSNAWIRTKSNATYSQASMENYSEFQLSWAGNTYNSTGGVTVPVMDGSLWLQPATPYNPTVGVPECNAIWVPNGQCAQVEQCPGNINGYPAYAGPPCAFACHWDGGSMAGNGNDLWALARRQGVALRLDTLKNATQNTLTAMQTNNMAINNLSVGIYTFNTSLTQVYPTNCTPQAFGCEAGSDWPTASSRVGWPPQTAGVYTDTGIQPALAALGGDNDNTAVEEAMNNLATNYVTAAGDGSSASKPRKVLILITDGFEDDPLASVGINGLRQAMPSSACQPFKDMGYTVYVIYTRYYPLPHTWYLANGIPIVEGTTSASIQYNLNACASNSNDFVIATDQSSLKSALLAFLTDALDSPATFIR